MFSKLKNQNLYFIFLGDMLLFALAHVIAYCIRFEFDLPEKAIQQMLIVMPVIILFKCAVFYYYGLYRGMWRYAGLTDMQRLFKATLFSSLAIMAGMLVMYRFSGFSRAVFILDGGLTFLLTGGMRMAIRVLYQKHMLDKGKKSFDHFDPPKEKKPVLIIGAGDAGEKTLRELAENPRLPFKVVGFIDDDTNKKGRSIHGVPILGMVASLSQQIEDHKIEELFIATPSATGVQMRRIVEACKKTGVRFRTLPSLGELIDGKVSVKALRDVNYQDLLGRPPVQLDSDEILSYLNDKTVLVTGAGGSIGAELCRQIVRFTPARLVLLDASEAYLYRVQTELKQRVSYVHYVTVLGAVQNGLLMERVFNQYRPQVVFHAAAYKHVPMLEENPWQAVSNNIKGSQTVMECCVRHHVQHFVLVSTDKAVRPTNVMGASKRVCEMVMLALMGNGTRMTAVRFGNVVGSSGSVVPLFRDQIARGGPVTITHPEVTRFFMTIPEATRLILQTGAISEGGEIFILEMGTPVKIVDMARDLIRLSGKAPDTDIEIVFTGLRPGEKLYEELITEGEGIVATDHKKIMVLKSDGYFNGHGSQGAYKIWLYKELKSLYRLIDQHDGCAIREKLKQIVPEYTVQESECIL